MEKRLRWYWSHPTDLRPWHLDETYVKIGGKWAYLYRAVDSHGRTIDFYLSSRRNTQAAYRFLKKMLGHLRDWEQPRRIITDKAPTYGRALALLKQEGKCPPDVVHRQVKYLNNLLEQDHRFIKKITAPMRGFKAFHSANATLPGIETAHMIRKGQFGENGLSDFQQFAALAA